MATARTRSKSSARARGYQAEAYRAFALENLRDASSQSIEERRRDAEDLQRVLSAHFTASESDRRKWAFPWRPERPARAR